MGTILLTGWDFDPTLVVGIGGLAVLYLSPLGQISDAGVSARTRRWQTISFLAGVGVLAFALISPLDALSDRYLFSAHMFQHLLLLLVVPVLLLWGAPDGWFAWLLGWRAIGWALRRFGRPLPSLLLYVGAIWIWHVPSLYEAALANQTIHVGEHLCFLGTALLYWWPICRSRTHPEPMSELLSLAYLFGAAICSTALSALITFSGTVLYSTYSLPGPDRAIQVALGMTPLVDQQTGGLEMWVGGAFWIVGAAMIIFVRWFERPSEDSPERLAADVPPH